MEFAARHPQTIHRDLKAPLLVRYESTARSRFVFIERDFYLNDRG